MKTMLHKAIMPVTFILAICCGITTAYVLNSNEIKLIIDYESNPPYTEMTLQFSKDIFIVSDIDSMKKDIAQKLSITFNPTLDYVIKPLDSRNCIVEIYNPKPAHEYQFTININNVDAHSLHVTANNKEIEFGKTYLFKTPVLQIGHCYRDSKVINSTITLSFNLPVLLNVLKQKMSIKPGVQYTLEYDSSDVCHKQL